jgi:manganese transport protein
LNVKLVINQISEWITNSGSHKIWLQLTIVPLALLVAFVLLYITIKPFIVPGTKTFKELFLHDQVQLIEQKTIDNPQKIAVAIDFCPLDLETISNALKQGGKQAEYVLIHVVETAGALLMGAEIEDQESMDDKNNLNLYGQQLVDQGYTVTTQLGFGNPGKVIPQIVKDLQSDLLVIGAQDHNGWKHFFRSSLVNTIRNKVNIPVLTVTEKTGKV